MTVETTEMKDYFALENLEKAKELVALILSENCYDLRQNVKSNYSSLHDDYDSRYRDWSGYTDQFLKTNTTSENPMYSLWNGMKQRCYNTNSISYAYYGGRGITMDSEWKSDFNKFANDILSSLGRKPHPFYTIDRIDNNGNYVPGNIRWVAPMKQARNRNNLRISETSGLALSILYKYYKITGIQLKDIYNNYLAESEDRKIKKSWSSIYTAAKSYNEFV